MHLTVAKHRTLELERPLEGDRPGTIIHTALTVLYGWGGKIAQLYSPDTEQTLASKTLSLVILFFKRDDRINHHSD